MNDQEAALTKARQFATSAFAVALDASARKFRDELVNIRARAAARGALPSGIIAGESCNVYGKYIDSLVLSRLGSLLEGYELYEVKIDDQLASATLDEVMNFRDIKLGDVLKTPENNRGSVTADVFAQMVQSECTVSRASVNVEIQRRLKPKQEPSIANGSRTFRWEDLDNRLISPKLQELSDEMQKKSVEGERKAAFDTKQSGNSAGYLPRLFDFQERLTDEWAQGVYAAHCETWSQQNRVVTGEFIRAVRDRAIIPVIAARKSTVQFEMSLRGTRIGENPNPLALGEWNRRMDRLAARWSQRLEADAVAEEYRASRPADVNDDRHFALLAIEEARKSVAEDDRQHPRVGAVVVKNGTILAKAHRGETPKSHAEYVALEWKLSNETLAGATVYTTLEPCIKRNPPKICCAQRLADRKVARVLIGMLDPNPDIRGLGDQLLSEAGIEVQLFPRDLRAQVEEMNREFIRDQKEKWKSRTSAAGGSRDEFRNPQLKSEFLGEYPDGPILWITADREIMLTQLDYLDLHEAKIDSDKTELSGQDFRLPVDHAKLVRINNLMHSGGRPFRMKFRVEVGTSGRSISHVIPAIIQPAMKPIQGTMTVFMRIVGSSTTGYAP